MKQPKKIIFNGLIVLSLFLCVAATALCIRSYWVEDSLTWFEGNGGEDPDTPIRQYIWLVVSSRCGLMVQSTYTEWGGLAGWIECGRYFKSDCGDALLCRHVTTLANDCLAFR